MKKIILLTAVCFLAIGLVNAKNGKKHKTNKKVKSPIWELPTPMDGRWEYGTLRETPDGWFKCENGPGKCAFIVNKAAVNAGTSGYYVYLNQSTNVNETNLVKYDVNQVLVSEDETGCFIFVTSPPIHLP
ncbi:MAG: hypothetical protein V4538_13195 [Bacteroidota bacterium]